VQRCATEKIHCVGLGSRIQQHGDAGGAAAGARMVKGCRALLGFSFLFDFSLNSVGENVVGGDDKEGRDLNVSQVGAGATGNEERCCIIAVVAAR